MNSNEQLIDANIDHLVDLTRVESSIKGSVLGILSDLEKELIAEINKFDIPGVKATHYQQARLKKLLSEAQASIKLSYGDINRYTREQQKLIAKAESIFTENSINDAVGVDVANVTLNTNELTALANNTLIEGAPSNEWWSRQSVDLTKKFTDQTRRGVLMGETNAQIIQRIRGTKARGYTDGIMNTSRNNAAALVNTSVQAVANTTRMEGYKEQDDIAKGYRYISTMDNRTSTMCQARSDLLWTLEGKPVGHHIRFERPPIHFNCRSTISLVLKTYDEISGKAKTVLKDELTPRQRAVMGGNAKVANYEDWLSKQPEAAQINILGKKKWDVWQTGKLSFRDLVDQRGNPLSIDELTKKVGTRKVTAK